MYKECPSGNLRYYKWLKVYAVGRMRNNLNLMNNK
jgi:hypothetical protein